MECRIVEQTEIDKILERNNGQKSFIAMKVSDEQNAMSDEQLYKLAKTQTTKKDMFTLSNDFDLVVATTEDKSSLDADFVIFEEGGKYIRVVGDIIKTGKSYIITKNGVSVIVGVGNSQLYKY